MTTKLNFAFRIAIMSALLPSVHCGEAEIKLPATLGIVATAPSHGAINIAHNTKALLIFSHEINESQDLASYVEMIRSEDESTVATQLELLEDKQTISVEPDSSLQADTQYTITLSPGIAASDESIAAFPTNFHFSFTSAP